MSRQERSSRSFADIMSDNPWMFPAMLAGAIAVILIIMSTVSRGQVHRDTKGFTKPKNVWELVRQPNGAPYIEFEKKEHKKNVKMVKVYFRSLLYKDGEICSKDVRVSDLRENDYYGDTFVCWYDSTMSGCKYGVLKRSSLPVEP